MSTTTAVDLEVIPPPPSTGGRVQGYKPVRRLGGWLQSVVLGSLLVNLALLVVAPGSVEVDGRFEFTQSAVETLVIADLAVLILVALSSLVWCHRVTANARPLGALGFEPSPASAVYWWFVPIASLFKPFQVVRDVFRASEPTYEHGTTRWQALATPPLVVRWWAAFVGTSAWTRVSIAIWSDDGDFDIWLTAVSVAAAIALALWFAVIRAITQRQRHRATRLARQGTLPAELADFART